MIYNRFDVCFAEVQFEDKGISRDRPIIIMQDMGDYTICLKCTTNLKTPVHHQHIQMLPEAGLHQETTIVLKSYIKLFKDQIRVKTGHLDIYDIASLQARLDEYKNEMKLQEKLILNESLFEEYNANNEQLYREIALQVRKEIINKYGEDFLYGKCIEASDRIVDLLSKKGVNSKSVEGWVHYDCDEGCTDRDYDEHTWVETEDGYVIDVTATQFNHFMDEDYPDIIISKELPWGYSYDEPDNYLDDYSDEEWSYKNLIEELSNIEYRPISNINKFKTYADEILGGYGGMSDSDIKRDIEEIYIDGELKGYIGLSKYNEEDGTKLLGIGNFMIIERGKGYGTQVINDIVSKYKNEYDLIYCFVDSDNEGAISLYKKLGKVYDEDGPNDNGQYYVTFYDNGKYKLEESLMKNIDIANLCNYVNKKLNAFGGNCGAFALAMYNKLSALGYKIELVFCSDYFSILDYDEEPTSEDELDWLLNGEPEIYHVAIRVDNDKLYDGKGLTSVQKLEKFCLDWYEDTNPSISSFTIDNSADYEMFDKIIRWNTNMANYTGDFEILIDEYLRENSSVKNLTEAKKRKKKISQVNPGEAIFKSVKDMQKWVKKRQKGMGYFVHMDCGNMDYNNDMFNKMHGLGDTSSSSTTDGGASDAAPSGGDVGGGMGMGESLEMNKDVIKLSPNLMQFIKENRDLINQNTKESWNKLYQEVQDPDMLGDDWPLTTSEFTHAIISAGAYPLKFLDYIPAAYLWYSDNIQNFTIPNHVKEIHYAAFRGSNLKRLFIPDSVVYIEEYAFADCENLEHVSLPKVKSLGQDIFDGSLLDEIEFRGTCKEFESLHNQFPYWTGGSKINLVRCKDGIVELN